MIKRFIHFGHRNNHGQSFVELALVVLILALILAGVVEFGFLLNNYLKVLDGAREGARFSNMSVPFMVDDNGNCIIDGVTHNCVSSQTFYLRTAIEAMRVMFPVVLNKDGYRGDDIVVSVFTVSGSSIVRWPYGYDYGWNLCHNNTDLALVNDLDQANWISCTAKHSNFSTDQIHDRMDASAPGSGVLLVEVFYSYPQLLKLPVFAQVIPDPIPVYVYAVMPLSSAEPTPGP
jgi:hypothetical protein